MPSTAVCCAIARIWWYCSTGHLSYRLPNTGVISTTLVTVVAGIKAIKLHAWEEPFLERMRQARAPELEQVRCGASLLYSAQFALWGSTIASASRSGIMSNPQLDSTQSATHRAVHNHARQLLAGNADPALHRMNHLLPADAVSGQG